MIVGDSNQILTSKAQAHSLLRVAYDAPDPKAKSPRKGLPVASIAIIIPKKNSPISIIKPQ